MTKQKKILLNYLLKQYKQSLKQGYKRKFEFLGTKQEFKIVIDQIRKFSDQYIDKIDNNKMEIFTSDEYDPRDDVDRNYAIKIREFYH